MFIMEIRNLYIPKRKEIYAPCVADDVAQLISMIRRERWAGFPPTTPSNHLNYW
jgi:hypothetical protein